MVLIESRSLICCRMSSGSSLLLGFIFPLGMWCLSLLSMRVVRILLAAWTFVMVAASLREFSM